MSLHQADQPCDYGRREGRAVAARVVIVEERLAGLLVQDAELLKARAEDRLPRRRDIDEVVAGAIEVAEGGAPIRGASGAHTQDVVVGCRVGSVVTDGRVPGRLAGGELHAVVAAGHHDDDAGGVGVDDGRGPDRVPASAEAEVDDVGADVHCIGHRLEDIRHVGAAVVREDLQREYPRILIDAHRARAVGGRGCEPRHEGSVADLVIREPLVALSPVLIDAVGLWHRVVVVVVEVPAVDVVYVAVVVVVLAVVRDLAGVDEYLRGQIGVVQVHAGVNDGDQARARAGSDVPALGGADDGVVPLVVVPVVTWGAVEVNERIEARGRGPRDRCCVAGGGYHIDGLGELHRRQAVPRDKGPQPPAQLPRRSLSLGTANPPRHVQNQAVRGGLWAPLDDAPPGVDGAYGAAGDVHEGPRPARLCSRGAGQERGREEEQQQAAARADGPGTAA